MSLEAPTDNRTLDGATSREFLARYESALDRLRAWPIALPGSSRLIEYQKVLRRWAATDPHQMVDVVSPSEIHALHETQEVIGIVESLHSTPTSEEMIRLRYLPKEGFEPTVVGKTSARDHQFELVVAGWLRRGGVACEMSTPDIVITHENEQFGVEAKRPKSEKQVRKVVSDARDVLENAKMVGVVAISIDLMIRPGDGLLRTLNAEHSQRALQSRVRRWTQQHVKEIKRKSTRSKYFVGLILIATIPVLEGNALRWAGTTQYGANPEHDARVKWLIRNLVPTPDFSTFS